MGGFDLEEAFDVLRSRAALLAAVADAAQTPADLATELGVSRSTIDRGLNELERVGFVETVGGTVLLTLSGRMALSTHTRFVDQLNDVGEAADVLEPLAPDAPFDPVLVDGSDAIVASDPDDEEPLNRLTSFIEDAKAVRGCKMAALPAQVDAYYRRVTTDTISVQLVVTEAVVERLVTEYRPQLAELSAIESVSLRSIESLPYGLLVVERPSGPVAVLSIYSSDGLVGVVHNDSTDAVCWAHSQIDRWWAMADPLPASTTFEE
ncbi:MULTISPECIES: winged helix-turn-helix domain-containing protein [Haloferax]|uniref:Helix-turn-helix domain-containing protein n=2 Tax=Haloferax TaxID=2251 RepID=A0A6G1Z394_9EURY|nr:MULTISPECIES: helix-turn-helix domain-containing protein [Haloferax]KAB1188285.1 helix-turn-helix domain-containing protein [Haloferax sp. CBA1149]MRW80973.1 helix-turn-helix domain-containing protein [Haloferax marinisediminis]